MTANNTTPAPRHDKEFAARQFLSLTDIRNYKDEVKEEIDKDEEHIAELWNELFHKEDNASQTKAQRFTKMLSLGTGLFDGVMLGWKLYRKYQNGGFFFKKRRR